MKLKSLRDQFYRDAERDVGVAGKHADNNNNIRMEIQGLLSLLFGEARMDIVAV